MVGPTFLLHAAPASSAGPRLARGNGSRDRCSRRRSATERRALRFAFSEDVAMAKRQVVEPKRGDKRYVRRDEKGQFTDEQDDVGKSLTQDRRKHAKHAADRGEGDRGDRDQR
jgi:hypothetical protein